RPRSRTGQAWGCHAGPVLKTGWATGPAPLRRSIYAESPERVGLSGRRAESARPPRSRRPPPTPPVPRAARPRSRRRRPCGSSTSTRAGVRRLHPCRRLYRRIALDLEGNPPSAVLRSVPLQHDLVRLDRDAAHVRIGRVHRRERSRPLLQVLLRTEADDHDHLAGAAVGEHRDPLRGDPVGRAVVTGDLGNERIEGRRVGLEIRYANVFGHTVLLLERRLSGDHNANASLDLAPRHARGSLRWMTPAWSRTSSAATRSSSTAATGTLSGSSSTRATGSCRAPTSAGTSYS